MTLFSTRECLYAAGYWTVDTGRRRQKRKRPTTDVHGQRREHQNLSGCAAEENEARGQEDATKRGRQRRRAFRAERLVHVHVCSTPLL